MIHNSRVLVCSYCGRLIKIKTSPAGAFGTDICLDPNHHNIGLVSHENDRGHKTFISKSGKHD